MFFPWLDGRKHHNAALRGGWTFMEAWNGGDAARRTEWRPASGPWFEDYDEARSIVLKGQAAAAAREAARKARDATRRKSPLETGGMPGS